MNIRHIAFLLALTAALALPGTAGAYNNQFSVALGTGAGDNAAGTLDVKQSQFSIGYTRFFTGIETTETPYAVREFLQHPSTLSVGLDYTRRRLESTTSNQALRLEQGVFYVSGIYYLDSDTGIGGALMSHPGSTNYENIPATVNEVHSGSTFTLTLHQYLTEAVRVGADLSSGGFRTKDSNEVQVDKYDETRLLAYVDALINEFYYIRAGIGTGEQEYDGGGTTDLSSFSLTAGVFPSQRLGVFLTHEVETEDDPSEETTITNTEVAGEYFFSDRTSLEGTLGILEVENGLDIDATILSLSLNFVY